MEMIATQQARHPDLLASIWEFHDDAATGRADGVGNASFENTLHRGGDLTQRIIHRKVSNMIVSNINGKHWTKYCQHNTKHNLTALYGPCHPDYNVSTGAGTQSLGANELYYHPVSLSPISVMNNNHKKDVTR